MRSIPAAAAAACYRRQRHASPRLGDGDAIDFAASNERFVNGCGRETRRST
jgi:hypothetical protein